MFEEEEIRYAGNGGRDAKSGHQVTDQVATGTNLALLKSQETGQPVRVLRKVPTEDGGPDVYRYEGLYRIVGSSYGPWQVRLQRVCVSAAAGCLMPFHCPAHLSRRESSKK
jgi:hypothetical protein